MNENRILQHTTDELFQLIQSSPHEFFSREPQDISHSSSELFADYLKEIMGKYKITSGELIARANLSKSHLYQILSGERNPSRDIVLVIALAITITLAETQRLLKLAQKSELYPRVRRDAAVICCIEQHLSLFETNDFIESISEEPLL